MKDHFENLSEEERQLLYKAPILLSVLASCSPKEVHQGQKADAIKLAHLKTFTAMPSLLSYYAEVEKNFKEQFEDAIEKYCPCDESKRNEIKKELAKINLIINKLDKEWAQSLHISLEKFANHVKKARHSVFQDFIFPIPLEGFTF
ncbi:MAG: hypothetical protein ABIO82_02575 [Ginsengibacter sp.]